jgi:hypothetical protein
MLAARAVTAMCEEARVGYAFENRGHSADWTVTIMDGFISSIVIDFQGNGEDTAAVGRYRLWVAETHPESSDMLFGPTLQRILTPDTIELHRELAIQWQEEQ